MNKATSERYATAETSVTDAAHGCDWNDLLRDGQNGRDGGGDGRAGGGMSGTEEGMSGMGASGGMGGTGKGMGGMGAHWGGVATNGVNG